MHTIELSHRQVKQLVDFCLEHKITKWFIAKDQGAYLGASTGMDPAPKCLFYFPGCDPEKDEDWYDTAHAKFGGDDFGEHMPVADLQRYLANPNMLCLEVKVTSKAISLDTFEVPSKDPNVDGATAYYGLRRPNGKIGCVLKDTVDNTLLQIGGGGTPAHIAAAKAAGAELREKGSVTYKGYWIGPLSEV